MKAGLTTPAFASPLDDTIAPSSMVDDPPRPRAIVNAPFVLDVDENESPLSAIAELVALRADVEAAIAEQVARARKAYSKRNEPNSRSWRKSMTYDWNGAPWAHVGKALGTSGQAAQQRYGRKS